MNSKMETQYMYSVVGEKINRFDEILTEDAIQFICELEEKFGSRRLELLDKRKDVQSKIDAGYFPDFLSERLEGIDRILNLNDRETRFEIRNQIRDEMSRKCKLSNKKPLVGNHVSKSNIKTKRRQFPNLQAKKIFIPELKSLRGRLTTSPSEQV